MIKQPTDIIQQAQSNIADQFSDTIRKPLKAKVGNPADPATIIISDSDKTGLIYIHGFGTDPQSAYTAMATGIDTSRLIYGQPVLAKRTTNGYVIIGLDPDNEGTFNSGAEIALDQKPVYINQIFYGNLHPSKIDLTWLIVGGWYGSVWIDDQYTADFSASPLDTSSNAIDVPTTNNQALIVMVQIDPLAGTLSYKQSAEFNASASFKQIYKSSLFPIPDAEKVLIGYLQLTKGVSISSYNATQSAPQWINNSAIPTSSADVTNPPTDAELDSAFGTPAALGDGFVGLLDDNAGDANVYLCTTNGTSWWYTALTKAVQLTPDIPTTLTAAIRRFLLYGYFEERIWNQPKFYNSGGLLA